MPTGPAARLTDPISHPLPPVLGPGPGSIQVQIGFLPAWRGIPLALVPALQVAKQISDTAIKVAEAATVAAAGTPGAPAAYTAEQTLKGTSLGVMGSLISAAAAGGADKHMCVTPSPVPPHGPGVVIDASPTVLIGMMPAARMGDTILEAIGPPNKIAMGCMTVIIGTAYLPGLTEMANAVNPAGSVINCGNIVDAVIARLYGTNPNAVSPAGQDGSFTAIGARHGTTITFGHTMRDAFNAVQAGGPGTTALIGISYAGGGSHIVTMTNVGGHVGIVEGQNWGAGNPREVITDVSRAEARYGANSDIGIGVLPNRAGAPP